MSFLIVNGVLEVRDYECSDCRLMSRYKIVKWYKGGGRGRGGISVYIDYNGSLENGLVYSSLEARTTNKERQASPERHSEQASSFRWYR